MNTGAQAAVMTRIDRTLLIRESIITVPVVIEHGWRENTHNGKS